MKLKKALIISAASVALLGAGAGAGIFIANNGLADSVTTSSSTSSSKKSQTNSQKKKVEVKVDMATAIKTALKEAKSGKVVASELEFKRNTPVYEIKILDGDTEKEYQVDANTGKIVNSSTEKISNDSDNLELSNLDTKVSLADAIKKAQEKYSSAKIFQVELEMEDGKAVYEIKLTDNNKRIKLVISADDGSIVSESTR
ncbi:PepSY domain-containing protein [Ligilactobacillus apodemi]|uniref:PepSY domain-containing protein n=1 Tax=Ligilactobacillus apodemi DSM 16634 = JCM 16172 TaxID=1423724 RepID=A0A0R1TT85_9LACO|nr:PepSY domain-containing protein [Ligilactobacillus apodemi]KRL84527.1 hypothetical protein FC32_GL000547 [Ligilactobacillus apodemi DSM 16634 = JCM 16172]